MVAIMLWTFLLIGLIFLGHWVSKKMDDPVGYLGAVILYVLSFFAFVPVCCATGGLLSGYSDGEREGYITKISVKGIIWKTNEIEVQVGTGEQAALQAPHQFSVVDQAVLASVKANVGKRVKIRYVQWLLQPYSRGDSGYEVTSVEPLLKNKAD